MTKKGFLGLLVAAMGCLAQTPPKNVWSFGTSFNPGGSPKLAGTALYARLVQESTYMFTAVDILPVGGKEFRGVVTTQFSGGIATKVLKIKEISIYTPSSAGVSTNGQNVGWAWTTGGLVDIPFGAFRIQPIMRMVKSSVSNGAGYQLISGVLFGWGQ